MKTLVYCIAGWLLLAVVSTASVFAFDEGSLVPDGKFEGLQLTPTELDGGQADGAAPNTTGSLSDSPSQLGAVTDVGVPEDVAAIVWPMIDDNKNGVATDRETFAALKPLRVLANSRKASPERDAVRSHLKLADGQTLGEKAAIVLLANVRGSRCPTAARAKRYLDSLDTDGSGAVDGNEIRSLLEPLGQVGRYLFSPAGATLKGMDLDGSHSIDATEAYASANLLLRLQLATEGDRLAARDPADWFKFVSAVSYLDVDADNVVSPAEAADAPAVYRSFASIDRNRDRQISPTELCDFQTSLDLAAAMSSGSIGGS